MLNEHYRPSVVFDNIIIVPGRSQANVLNTKSANNRRCIKKGKKRGLLANREYSSFFLSSRARTRVDWKKARSFQSLPPRPAAETEKYERTKGREQKQRECKMKVGMYIKRKEKKEKLRSDYVRCD